MEIFSKETTASTSIKNPDLRRAIQYLLRDIKSLEKKLSDAYNKDKLDNSVMNTLVYDSRQIFYQMENQQENLQRYMRELEDGKYN